MTPDEPLSPADIQALFTRADGQYLFARWGRPIVPVVFGVDEPTIAVLKGAIEAVVVLADHKMAETDTELGANLMVFFVRDWDELTQTPILDRLIPDLAPLVTRLKSVDANQYRSFRFDPSGGIKAAFVFIRMDADMQAASADTIALSQMVQTILLWSDAAFLRASPLAILRQGGAPILKPQIADVIRAGYDPILPVAATDPAHALRLSARVGRRQ